MENRTTLALGRTGGRPPDGGAGGSRHLLPGRIPANGGPVAALRCGPSEPAAAGLRRGRAGYLQRRFSRQLTEGLGALLGGAAEPVSAPEDWRPVWAGEFPGLALPEGALCRRAGRRRYLALPFREDGPFPLTGLFCLASVRTLGARGVGHFCTGGPGDIKKFTFTLPYLVGMWYTTPKLADYPPKNGRREAYEMSLLRIPGE